MSFKRTPLVFAPLPATLYPFTTDGVSMWFAQALKRHRPSHERLFQQYVEAYRVSEGTEKELKTRLDAVNSGQPYRGDLAYHLRILEQRRVDVEVAAEGLLMSLDGMLAGLRYRLFVDDRCQDHGPMLRNSVSVDRALDAIGNYVRHEYEWFGHDYTCTWPNKQQSRSIRPLAQLHTSRPIEDEQDAYQEFTKISLPAAFVLDLLAEYESVGDGITFATVELKVGVAAFTSIEKRLGPRLAR